MYTPREDSFLIQKHIKEFCTQNSFVLDMGTGSGILALEASKYSKTVIACDIDAETISNLKKTPNLPQNISIIQSDLFSKIPKTSKFDLIIFNPPYIPTNKKETRFLDLDGGKNGTEIIERFLKDAKQFLKTNGKILLLTSSLNKNVTKLFNNYHYTYLPLDKQKFAFEELWVWVLDPQF